MPRRRTTAGLAALVAGAALLLTGCGHGPSGPAKVTQSVSVTDDGQLKDMQQKVDAAESAAAQADSDATQNN